MADQHSTLIDLSSSRKNDVSYNLTRSRDSGTVSKDKGSLKKPTKFDESCSVFDRLSKSPVYKRPKQSPSQSRSASALSNKSGKTSTSGKNFIKRNKMLLRAKEVQIDHVLKERTKKDQDKSERKKSSKKT